MALNSALLSWTTAAAVALLALLLLAVVIDLRSRRIPNDVSLGGAMLALLLALAVSGQSGAMSALTGWLVGMALPLPLYALRVMGAGDVKLLGMVGAFVGAASMVDALLFTFAAGALTGLVALMWRDGVLHTIQRYAFGLKHLLRSGAWLAARPREADSDRPLRAPYAIAIAVGAVMALAIPLVGDGSLIVSTASVVR